MVNQVDDRELKRFILDQADGDILDCGCGDGELLRWLWHLKHGRLTGIDISPEKVNRALKLLTKEQVPDKRIDFEIMDIEDLDFADETFDTAILTDSLQYIVRPSTALAEVARVLKPGGKIVVAVTAFHTKGGGNYGQFDVAKLPELVGESFTTESIEERGGTVRLVGRKRPGEVRRVLELRPKRH